MLACTRKDIRLLFKFVKVFTGLGELRATLNHVILDPSTASRVSELALNPGMTEAEGKGARTFDSSWGCRVDGFNIQAFFIYSAS